MNALMLTHIAWTALSRNKLRTGLALLGIAIGEGASIRVEKSIATLGANLIWIEEGSVNRGGVRTGPARIKIFEKSVRRSILVVEIPEGRKREVRRMLESVGHSVQTLKRVEFAGLRLAPQAYGKWRFLKKEEVRNVKMQMCLIPARPDGRA